MFRNVSLSRVAAFGVFAFCLSLGAGPAKALYDVEPGAIKGEPGTVIRIWPLESGGPGNSEAFRFLYRSTGLNGESIPVSGAIFVPSGRAPAGGRDVIAWAHPTSGVVPDCAPSLYPNVAGLIWNLGDMLRQGHVVVATDYPGLGTRGTHPFMIGESEARAVLDSVRAAGHIVDGGTSNRFALWGHSQGGHAVLFAGRLAKSYAPELKLVGIAAAAPATYLVELFKDDADTEQDLIAMALLAWSSLYKIPPSTMVKPDKMAAFNKTARGCLTSVRQFETLEDNVKPLEKGQWLKADPTTTEPWKGIMVRNTPGPTPRDVPVFIAQGTADMIVQPHVTKRYAEGLCAAGVRVSFMDLPGTSHVFAARDAAPTAIRWMDARFRGEPAPSSCR
jgi:acetyl esterase/lipase